MTRLACIVFALAAASGCGKGDDKGGGAAKGGDLPADHVAAVNAALRADLKGKLDGYAMRVPTPNVSVVDFVAILKKNTTGEEVNAALKSAAEGELKGILSFTMDPVVSSDMMKNPNSSIVDGQLTKVLDGNLAKVVAWYDNEWGYSCRVVDLIGFLAKKGL